MAACGKAVRFFAILGATIGVASAASALKNSDCLDCHNDKTLSKTGPGGRELSLFVDAAKLAASVHRTNTCVSCHADVTGKHPDDNRALKSVECSAWLGVASAASALKN